MGLLAVPAGALAYLGPLLPRLPIALELREEAGQLVIGWNADARYFLRQKTSDSYILNIPFLEGPKQPEGFGYEQVQVRVLLPEGAE